MTAAVETLKPTDVAIKLIRGTDNTFIFTVLGSDGLPKDMSGYAAVVPQIRFSNLPRSSAGAITPPGNFAQAQVSSGNLGGQLGICEWLNGGVGGQIHVVVPELDFTDGITPFKGTKNADAVNVSGQFDIQIRGNVDLSAFGCTSVLTGEGSPSAYHSIQRAVRGTWGIDKEVTAAI